MRWRGVCTVDGVAPDLVALRTIDRAAWRLAVADAVAAAGSVLALGEARELLREGPSVRTLRRWIAADPELRALVVAIPIRPRAPVGWRLGRPRRPALPPAA